MLDNDVKEKSNKKAWNKSNFALEEKKWQLGSMENIENFLLQSGQSDLNDTVFSNVHHISTLFNLNTFVTATHSIRLSVTYKIQKMVK